LHPRTCFKKIKKKPNPVAEALVPLALNDAAMFHALLAFSSSLIDARSGRKTGSTATLIHRVNAIGLINQSTNDIQAATSNKALASIMFVSGSDVGRRISSKTEASDSIYLLWRSACSKIIGPPGSHGWHLSDCSLTWRH
jgi:hypothetical protein